MPELMKEISFGKLDDKGMAMPHLLDIQTRAFEALLQLDAASHDREDIGLERVFKDLFPITDVHENFSLEFVRYTLGEPKYTVEECIERDMTYSAPLKATLQLVINEEVNGVKRPRNIIEKEVYLGELPLLTPLGTFVINGAERVIVSQLHRSPGVVFEESTHPNGQRLISSRIRSASSALRTSTSGRPPGPPTRRGHCSMPGVGIRRSPTASTGGAGAAGYGSDSVRFPTRRWMRSPPPWPISASPTERARRTSRQCSPP